MKKIIKLTTAALIIISLTHSAMAQKDQSKNKDELGIGFGLTAFGPARQMADLMVKYHFDDSYKNWFGGDIVDNPHYHKGGVSIGMSYYHYIGSRSKLGIRLNYTAFSEVFGYTNTGLLGFLNVKFSSVSIIPIYSFELNKSWEFEAGPALMFNSGNKDRAPGEQNLGSSEDKYTGFSAGLLTGVNLIIWKSRVTFGKIGSYYVLATGNKMGPYTPAISSLYIPKSKINFSYLNMLFTFGFRL